MPLKSIGIKTIFLDRDGVINRDSPDYIKSWDEFHFLPGSVEAITRLSQSGRRVILITNQSVIHRKMVLPETLDQMHANLKAAVREAGGCITDIFFCPHTPDEGCACRKPRPGLILAACRAHGLDPAECVMVGDSAKDIRCAHRAGCARALLVRTGNGLKAAEDLKQTLEPPDAVVDDLAAAVDWIFNNDGAAAG